MSASLMNKNQLDDDLFEDDPYSMNNDDDTNENAIKNDKKTNQRRRNRNKKKKNTTETKSVTKIEPISNDDDENDEKIEIELVPEVIDLDANYAEFTKVFEHFKFVEPGDENKDPADSKDIKKEKEENGYRSRVFHHDSDDDDDNDDNNDNKNKDKTAEPKLSKKQLKKKTRLSVAALKQLVNRPDVIEMHDCTAQDPKLLVNLKALRNTVPVPRHWCAKRKYLQGKRGFEKAPFDLPDFIKRTGIQGMREALQEKEANKSLKQKMREKIRPKMGKIDIDYQKLHDAFFRWQTKPHMSIHGDLYYEGKELETRLKLKKPGNLTDDLRIALGMPTGAAADKVPPPWLIAMQRYGPPPSYPSLKIPGLNAPIPQGCSFGYHAGGWGKPPVDEFGRPLYGDVFGNTNSDNRVNYCLFNHHKFVSLFFNVLILIK
jgi:splicing factor 3B subunit 2